MTLSPKQRTELDRAVQAGFDVLKTTPPMSAAQWADEYFYLSAESSYVKGPWTTVPNQLAILNAMGNDDIEEVNWPKSARVGYTKCLTAAFAYFIDHKARNCVGFWPDESSRDSFSKKHLDAAIRDVEPLRAKFPWLGKKHKNNTLDSKVFTNQNQIYLRAGRAAKNYREISVDVAVFDELSKFPRDVEKEGSPLFLGDKRLEGSVFRKSIRGSTPGVMGECQITEAAENAQVYMRRFVPCPHCGKHQVLVFGGKNQGHGLIWDDSVPDEDKPKTVKYWCRHCGAGFDYSDYIEADEKGYWEDTDREIRTWDGIDWFDLEGNPADTPLTVSFHLWSAYSHFSPWSRIVQDWLKAKKTYEGRKSFTNTTLGEAWEDRGQKVDGDSLFRKRESYAAEIPVDHCILTAAVDVQDDRLELLVKAWLDEEESYCIRYDKLYGDLSRAEIWAQLHRELTRSYRTPSGAQLAPRISFIDLGGHFSSEVYKFCRRYGAARFFPIKGSSQRGKPLVTWPKKLDPDTRTRRIMIGPDTGKDVVHARLTQTVMSPAPTGPGLIHWPSSEPFGSQFTNQFFEHLTNEERVLKRGIYVWDDKGRRNEPWDLEVYNLAAIRLLQMRFGINLASMRNTLAAPEAPEPDAPQGTPDAGPTEPAAPKPKPSARRRPRRKPRGMLDD
nr:terminase [Pseudomonadaceae bacterium]